MDEFTQAYIECALWASAEVEDYGISSLSSECRQRMIKDCDEFQKVQAELLKRAYARPGYSVHLAGHDFWLTRNRHGVGFWDRGLEDLGRALTDAAHTCGNVDLWVDDTGEIRG